MKTLAVMLVAIGAAGCATGKMLESPVKPRRITLQVEIDTKGAPIGAYQLVILTDPAEARIVGIEAPRQSDFIGQPHFLPWTFKEGATRVTGYSPNQPPPKGPCRLLSVVFEQLGGKRSPLAVKVERLYDTSTPPREIRQYVLRQSHEVLDFGTPD